MASHHSGLGLSLGQVMWDLWWTKLHWVRFSLTTSISHGTFHRLLQTHRCISYGAGTLHQRVADVPSGLSLTPL
jgi:hypothetical protein